MSNPVMPKGVKQVFGLTVKNKSDHLKYCLKSLRNFYKDDPVIIITDGDDNPVYDEICLTFKASLCRSEWLKFHPLGALWLHRFFVKLLSLAKAERYIKLDPDTRFLHPFVHFPSADLSGYLMDEPHRCFVVGSCHIFTPHALKVLIESNVLLDAKFKDEKYAWTRKEYITDSGPLSITDYILDDAINELGLTKARHREVQIRWGRPTPRYAYKGAAVISV